MELDRKAFTQALSVVSKVIEPRATLPILESVLVTPSEGWLALRGTDLEFEAVMAVPAQVGPHEHACFLLPARQTMKIIKALPKSVTRVTITATPDTLNVSGVTLAIMATVDDFPGSALTTPPAPEQYLPLPGLVGAFERCAVAMSHDESRFSLNGALLDLARSAVVATDGHRLHVVRIPKQVAERPCDEVIVPRAMVELVASPAIAKLLAGERAAIVPGGMMHLVIVFPLHGGHLASRLIDGQFPSYEAVMPARERATTTLTVRVEALVEALVAARVVADERSHGVSLVLLEGGEVKVYARCSDKGEVLTPAIADATFVGNPTVIGVNANYLLAALEAATHQTVTLGLQDATGPLRLDDGEFTAVVMPMQLKDRALELHRRLGAETLVEVAVAAAGDAQDDAVAA